MLPICVLRDISGLEAYSGVSVLIVLVVTAMVIAKTVKRVRGGRGEVGVEERKAGGGGGGKISGG